MEVTSLVTREMWRGQKLAKPFLYSLIFCVGRGVIGSLHFLVTIRQTCPGIDSGFGQLTEAEYKLQTHCS